MPSKIQLNENLWFLFICLQKSDYKTIDFNAVGKATNLKSPAARMRYTRLRRQIEGGSLNGTQGTQSLGMAKNGSPESAKRARNSEPEVDDNGQPALSPNMTSLDPKIKSEPEEFSDQYQSESSEGDSEDEMPLAKRRNDKVKPSDASSKGSPLAFTQPDFSFGSRVEQVSHPLGPDHQLNASKSRPEIHEDYLNVFQISYPSAHLYMPANHPFDVATQPQEGTEDPHHI